MWRFSSLGAVVAIVILLTVRVQGQVTVTPYLWEFAHVSRSSVQSAAGDRMVARLRAEVQFILDLGNELRPAQHYHGDIPDDDQYWVYFVPGRIITTLAWAYPYLSAAQQSAVNTYVTTELASTTHRPWATSPLTPTTGSARRERFPMNRITYVSYGPFGSTEPSVQTIYGLWLWGWRKGGDWSQINTHWTSIQSMYTGRAGQGNIYGTMGAHIGMARLARLFGSGSVESTATSNLQTALNDGLTFSTIESRVSTTPGYWAYQYAKGSLQYRGWMFLDASPEIARYIGRENIAAALTRHSSGKSSWPLWWVRQAPYDSNAAGYSQPANTEAGGMTLETLGMILPLERYAVSASAATLEGYTRSGPICYADLYWIEGLVWAIEAQGVLRWIDVRNGWPD